MAVTLNTAALKRREQTTDPWDPVVVKANTNLQPVLNITGDGQLNQSFSAGDLTDAANELKGETSALGKGIAIVVDGNKALASASAGQYVLLQNSTITGRADGLYLAATGGFSQGDTLNASHLEGSSGNPLPGGLGNHLKNSFQYSKFTTKITTTADSDAIGGNRGFVNMSTTVDPNYSSNTVAIVPIYANKAGSSSRPLCVSVKDRSQIWVLSATALNNADVEITVMYVYK